MSSEKNENKVSVLLPFKSFENDYTSDKENELRLIYGLTFEQEQDVYRDAKIFFNYNSSKFTITSNIVDEPVLKATSKKDAGKSSNQTINSAASKTPDLAQ